MHPFYTQRLFTVSAGLGTISAIATIVLSMVNAGNFTVFWALQAAALLGVAVGYAAYHIVNLAHPHFKLGLAMLSGALTCAMLFYALTQVPH